jgi:hypothetical protein
MKLLRVSRSPSKKTTGNNQPKAKTHEIRFGSATIHASGGPSVDQLRAQADAMLESAINATMVRLLKATTHDERMSACHELSSLVKQRSPQMIEQLERERGLR